MAEDLHSEFIVAEKARFHRIYSTILRTVYRDSGDFYQEINRHIDGLNILDYSLKIAKEEEVGQLLTQCCYLIPLSQQNLISKFCFLILNLVSKQQLILEHGLQTLTEYLVKGLQQCPPWLFADLLHAFACVIYENEGRLTSYHEYLVGSENGLLLQLAVAQDDDIQRSALQCVENLCIRTPGCSFLETKYQDRCLQLFLRHLQSERPANREELLHSRLLVSSLRGVQNILLANKAPQNDLLGPLLAALKVYTLFGIPGAPSTIPSCLYPTPLSQYDPGPQTTTTTTMKAEKEPDINLRPSTEKGSKAQLRKNKKKRGKGGKKEDKETEGEAGGNVSSGIETLSVSSDHSTGAVGGGAGQDGSSLFTTWGRMSSSESDYSDAEGGHVSKLKSFNSRVRQCAFGCFHALIKATDKRVMFGYWTAFLPDTPGVGPVPHKGATLFTAIMKDPSPKARTGALAVLTALLDGSKQYLMAAEDSDQYRNAPFTPFSVTLGYTVKEIHRCLLLALVSENSPLATTQIIKCLATLVPNVPYQRLKPGLISRIVKQIRPFLSHRDPNIRVACLTCLGSIAGVQGPLMEVCQILLPGRPPSRLSESSARVLRAASDSAYHSNHSSGEAAGSDTPLGTPSDIPTPSLSSGAQTPSLADSQVFSAGGDTSWVIKLCVKNINPTLLDFAESARSPTSRTPREPIRGSDPSQPLPVRLESLQLLAQLAKGYFPMLRNSLFLVRDLIHACLDDKDPSVQLHGAKLLDEMGSILLQKLQEPQSSDQDIQVGEALEFWLPLLRGPLPDALQSVSYHAVRSTVCDCLSNLGPLVFAQLPMDNRMLCITLLLGLTADDDRHVRAATIRALGVYVLYPTLREDVSFVADAANAIIKSLEEQNLNVRVKASWSLGNLSDAIVLNKSEEDQAFMDDFSDMLLLKLFDVASKGSQDNDKVKSNAVRALGNLLRYLPERSYNSSRFTRAIDNAIHSLIKNVSSGTMKVRWNACYATGNMFRNNLLPLGKAQWTDQIHTALMNVVKDCKNFKVRINAAMALSVPESRQAYGDKQLYTGIWDGLLTALKMSETITDFAEYRYRDSLTEQVCCTLVHLAGLIEVEDMKLLGLIVRQKRETLLEYLDKYKLLINAKALEMADKDAALKISEKHMKELQTKKGEEMVCNDTIDLLSKAFSSAPSEPSPDSSRPDSPKSAFVQTYD